MESTLGPQATTHRTSNLVKTAVLLAGMTALVLGIGQLVGGPRGLMWAGAIVVVMNFGSFWFSDRLALAMNRARPLPPGEVPALEQMVEKVAARAGVPTPRLYLVDSPTPNAFATGRSPDKSAIAFTTGILRLLGPRELQGVIAHELSHVKNRDTLIMTVAATLAGVITHVAQAVFWFGGSMMRRSEDNDRGGAGSALASLGVLIVAPLAATLLQLAISRAREFDADASAAQLTGDPDGLASALGKLESGNRAIPLDHSPATAHLFIVNPLSGRGVMGLFATHPSIEDRIERLSQMR